MEVENMGKQLSKKKFQPVSIPMPKMGSMPHQVTHQKKPHGMFHKP